MLKRYKRLGYIFLFLLVQSLFAQNALAELKIVITEGVNTARPIGILPFRWEGSGTPPSSISDIVAADLTRSGQFTPVAENQLPQTPMDINSIDFKAWTAKGIDSLLMGSVNSNASGQYVVNFKLVDLAKGHLIEEEKADAASQNVLLLNNQGIITGPQVRNFAHRVSDLVYEKLTGKKGAFLTRIAYVVVKDSLKTNIHKYLYRMLQQVNVK